MSTPTTQSTGFDVAGFVRAIENRNAGAQLAAFGPDPLVTIVDHEHPPSRPLTMHGTTEVRTYLADVCDRDLTHEVQTAVADHDNLTVELLCTYPDGTKVNCLSIAGLADGQIAWQRIVQAWDH
ncbi:MAG: hypothetical protein QOH52_4593 [Pseudonocardiales bacterium]|nr:hypothetical protein [Pseudonocardiales bacterium]